MNNDTRTSRARSSWSFHRIGLCVNCMKMDFQAKMKIPLQVYDSISRGRLAVSRYNGSGRFTLRIATLVLTSAVFGLLVSHLFVSSRSFNQNNSDVAEEYSELSLETNDDVQNTTIDQSSGNGLEADEDAETNYGTPWYRNVFQKLLFSGPLYNPEGQSEQSTLGDSIELGAPDKASESTMRPRITHGERPYVGKVTINVGNPDDDLCERAIKTHVAHNKIHNYQAFVLRHSQGSEFNRLWSKPAYLLSIVLRELAKPVGERLEWLFWADADTIIINPNIPAESFLPPVGFERIHLLLTEDASGLSDGVFFIRINTWSVEFLSSILAFPQYRPDTPLPLREQSAMMQLVGERNFKSHVMMMPQRWFNAYPGDMNHTVQDFHAKGGDLLVHFDDYSEQSETMEAWLKRAEAHDQSWEMEPQSTSYQSEIEAFWEDFKRKGKEKTKLLKDVHQDAHGVIDDIKTYATEYRNRFGPSLLDVVKAEIKQLRKTLEDDVYREDANRINDATGTLRQVCALLSFFMFQD